MNTGNFSNMNTCQWCGVFLTPPQFKCSRCASTPSTHPPLPPPIHTHYHVVDTNAILDKLDEILKLLEVEDRSAGKGDGT
jgi:hypothetical protein